MRLLLSPEQIERRGPWVLALMGLGFVGFFVLPGLGVSYGVLSSMAAVFLCATWGALQKYRSEPGIWMLACLIGLMGSCFWALFILADLVPRMRGSLPVPWPLAVDAAICTALWGESARIALSMGLHNWRMVRPS